MTKEICNTDDIIDSRDVIERFEELEGEVETLREEFDSLPENDNGVDFDNWVRNQTFFSSEDYDEYLALKALIEDCDTVSDWQHGAILINEEYFTEYAQELARDIGAVSGDESWPCTHIDWEAAAGELKCDYTTTEFAGTTYYVRY